MSSIHTDVDCKQKQWHERIVDVDSFAVQLLVTVIVPVYNVAACLPACVDSILTQTYCDLEIILVDDGSPDACPAICDTYAASDSRVRVIHKSNGGLSDARNVGLDAASGDLIGFVDSDDIVHPQMFERLVAAFMEDGSDIVGCSFAEFPDGTDPRDDDDVLASCKIHGVSERRYLDGAEATLLLLHDKELQNYVWNKLFRAELWKGVRFPVGQRFEDVNTTYKLFERAHRVTLLPDVLYYYRMRSDGIVRSRTLAGELDCVQANMERCKALTERYPQARQLMEDDIMRAMARLWPLVWQDRALLDDGLCERLRDLSAFACACGPSSRLLSSLGITGRLTVRLLAYPHSWSWFVAWVLYRMYGIKHEL